MARRDRPPQRALVAAATRVVLSDRKLAQRQAAKRQEWQAEAWAYAAEVPEIKFGVRFSGNALSKLRLFVAVRLSEDAEPIPIDDDESDISPDLQAAAKAELARLVDKPNLLRKLNMNLEVPGEAYLVGRDAVLPDKDGKGGRPEEWKIRSTSEVTVKNGVYTLHRDPGDRKGEELKEGESTVIRLHEEDAEWSELADSPVKGVLGEAKVLQILSQQVMAQAMRAASAGFLTVPNELSFGPADPTQGEDGDEAGQDPLEEVLGQVLVDPIEDPSSPSSVQPGLIRGQAEYLKPEYLRRIVLHDPSMDDSLEKRIEARVERIARGMNLPVEVLLGHQQTTFCVDEETEALTADGWRRHSDIRAGTMVLTLDHETGLSEWQPVLAVNRFDVVDEPVFRIERQSHSSVTTREHRWPVVLADSRKRAWRTTDGRFHSRLNTNCRVPTAAPCRDLPSEAKWSDEMVELVAWFYTEGSVDRRARKDRQGGLAVITQSRTASAEHVARIRNVLHRLVGPPVERLSRRGAWAWREYHDPNGRNARFFLSRTLTEALEVLAPDRVPTAEFVRSLTAAQLELFMRVSVLGDGWVVNTGTVMFSQNNPARNDAYELACILSGRTPSRWSVTRPGTGTLKNRLFTQHYCSVTDRTFVQPVSSRSRRPDQAAGRLGGGRSAWDTYSGTVWCPTTENGTWMVRRNGSVYFTGNSNAAQVDQDTFEDHLEPRCVLIADLLTIGFLRPNLLDAGHDAGQVARVLVWYDPSALVAKQDTEKNAPEAHDRFIISDESARHALGFSEDDAPDALEVLVRAGLKRGMLGGAVTVSLLQAIADEAGVSLPDVGSLLQAAAGRDGQTAALAQLLMLADRRKAAKRNGHNGQRPKVVTAALSTPKPNPGRRLMEIDRELRTRLGVAANAAMNRALERAGNRLRSKAADMRPALRDVPARSVAATLGPALALRAATADEALEGAWDVLSGDYDSWTATAQDAALDVLDGLVPGGLGSRRADLAHRQASDRADAWDWLAAALSGLAAARMFAPAVEPETGEFDPTLTVPPSLVRQALARAGGSEGLVSLVTAGGLYLVRADGGTRPTGGVASGELVREALRDEGVRIDAYQWDYGPALRQRPFLPHLYLDSVVYADHDDDRLASEGEFGLPSYEPGDHDGCQCSEAMVLVPPGDVS